MSGIVTLVFLIVLLIAATVAAPGMMILALVFGVIVFVAAGTLQGFGAFRDAIDNPDAIAPYTGGVASELERRQDYAWARRYGKYDPDWQRELERAAKEAERTLRSMYGDEAAERMEYWAAHDAFQQVRSARREKSRYDQEEAYRNLRLALGGNPAMARRVGFTGRVPDRVYPDVSEDGDPQGAVARGCALVVAALGVFWMLVLAGIYCGVLR